MDGAGSALSIQPEASSLFMYNLLLGPDGKQALFLFGSATEIDRYREVERGIRK